MGQLIELLIMIMELLTYLWQPKAGPPRHILLTKDSLDDSSLQEQVSELMESREDLEKEFVALKKYAEKEFTYKKNDVANLPKNKIHNRDPNFGE